MALSVKQKLERYARLGFDRTGRMREGFIRVKCSQCEVAAINGVFCHETGCSNATKECKGCNADIPVSNRWGYCEDCR